MESVPWLLGYSLIEQSAYCLFVYCIMCVQVCLTEIEIDVGKLKCSNIKAPI